MLACIERLRAVCGALLLVALTVGGCHSPDVGAGRQAIGNSLSCRMGHQLCGCVCPREIFIPPGVTLDDGLTEEEAISIALCNNALFQELLVDLRLANSDLIQAGLLPNPELVYYFPVSEKPYKYLVDFPIEALWLRHIRVAAADAELARTRDRLVQAGLNLIRDVRLVYSDVLLAQEQAKVGDQAIELRGKILRVTDARLNAGDISPQESATARIDSLQATQDLERLRFQVNIAFERLWNVLGVAQLAIPPQLAPAPPVVLEGLNVDALVADAISSRPDIVSTTEAVAAAQERLRLARIGWIRFLGIADATSGRKTGHELSPAFRITIPLFNRNEGGIARAEAELERASRQWRTLHDQVLLDVKQAYLQHEQARSELVVLRDRVRPEVETAIVRSQSAFQEGNTSYLLVLEATRQLLDSNLRRAQLETNLRRATAELERSVGRRLSAPAADAMPAELIEPPPPVPLPSNDQP